MSGICDDASHNSKNISILHDICYDSVNDCYDYVCVYTCATKMYIWGHMIAYDQPRMGGSSSPTMPRAYRQIFESGAASKGSVQASEKPLFASRKQLFVSRNGRAQRLFCPFSPKQVINWSFFEKFSNEGIMNLTFSESPSMLDNIHSVISNVG